MGRKQIILWMTIAGLIIGGLVCYLVSKYAPNYTARTYIEVLPPAEVDHAAGQPAVMQKDIQYGYRLFMASLLKAQSTLKKLIDRDKVRQSRWFKSFGKSLEEANLRALKDLNAHFGAFARRDSSLIEVHMSCRYPEEEAMLVNEMVELFVAQDSTKRADIVAKLESLENQRDIVQKTLEAIEKKKEPDMDRVQSEQRLRIRDERTRMLDAIKEQIEKLKILLDDAEKPTVRGVGNAPVPLEANPPRRGVYLSGGTVLGFLFGLGLTRRKGRS